MKFPNTNKSILLQNIETYSKVLPTLLTAICLQRPLILLIDGIDQVKSFSSYTINWLPVKLPDNIKLILSVAEESKMFQDIKAKVDSKNFIKMSPLGENEAKGILMSSVMQYNHSVNSRIQDCVLKSVQECTLPLYAKVTFTSMKLSQNKWKNYRYWPGKHRGGQIKNMILCQKEMLMTN